MSLSRHSGKEVAKKTFQLHHNHCVRNISKCTYCDQPIAKSEMEDHLEEMKGSEQIARQAAEEGDFDKLKLMQQHGADIWNFKDSANADNSLLHYAVKTNNYPLVQFIKTLNGVDFDIRNANGETALHMCCG